MSRVLCVGVTTLDLVFRVDKIPAHPAKVLANDFVETLGGMAANAAVAIARLGGSASLWSRVGDDDRGRWLLNELAQNGVDVSNVRQLQSCQSSISTILIGQNGEKMVCPYFDKNLDDDTSWLPLKQLSDYDIILLDPRWPAAVETITREARSLRIPTLLDADTGDVDLLKELIPLADNTIFSLPALQTLTGEAEIEHGLKTLYALNGKGVGSTAGKQGFYWYENDELLHVTPPTINSVDTLAAGDVFHGAFSLALAEGMSTHRAATFATTAATLKCTSFGGIRGAPSRADVEATLAQLN